MPMTLADIPTLQQSYHLKKIPGLAPGTTPRYPFKQALLERVSVYQGDITRLEVDAIVNAANESLLGGGGVDGQIHRAAGRGLLDECRTLDGCTTGQTKITKGHNLPSKHVLHTVGPIYSSSAKDLKAEQLRSCYHTCLDLTTEHSLKSVAFCAVSTGIYGYPITDATHIAMDEVRTYLDNEKADKIERVMFCVWSDKDKDVYEELVSQYFPDAEPGAASAVTAGPDAQKEGEEVEEKGAEKATSQPEGEGATS